MSPPRGFGRILSLSPDLRPAWTRGSWGLTSDLRDLQSPNAADTISRLIFTATNGRWFPECERCFLILSIRGLCLVSSH